MMIKEHRFWHQTDLVQILTLSVTLGKPPLYSESSFLPLNWGSWDFPGGAVVKNPPANAGDTGSRPSPGRSHMPWSSKACAPQLLSLRATTTEAHTPRAHALQQEKPPQ